MNIEIKSQPLRFYLRIISSPNNVSVVKCKAATVQKRIHGSLSNREDTKS